LAIAVAEASESARRFAAEKLFRRDTCIYTIVFHLFLSYSQIAPAMDYGVFCNHMPRFYTKRRAQFFRYGFAAGRTKISSGIRILACIRREGRRITRTPGKAARAAIGTRQTVQQFGHARVGFDIHDFGSYA